MSNTVIINELSINHVSKTVKIDGRRFTLVTEAQYWDLCDDCDSDEYVTYESIGTSPAEVAAAIVDQAGVHITKFDGSKIDVSVGSRVMIEKWSGKQVWVTIDEHDEKDGLPLVCFGDSWAHIDQVIKGYPAQANSVELSICD